MNTYLWVALLFGMTVTLYLMGYQPILFDGLNKYQNADYAGIPTVITSYILTWDGLTSIGASFVTGFILSGGNLAAVVPFVLASLILNLVVFPTSYITASGLPPEITLMITVFFTVTTFMVVMSFIRGN